MEGKLYHNTSETNEEIKQQLLDRVIEELEIEQIREDGYWNDFEYMEDDGLNG